MPEDMQPPRTIPEVGIHLLYMAKAQSETKEIMAKSQSETKETLEAVQKTLKDIQSDVVPRKEFDEHIQWGMKAYDGVNVRIARLEDRNKLDDSSIWEALKKQLLKSFVVAVAVAILIGILFFIIKTLNIDIISLIS